MIDEHFQYNYKWNGSGIEGLTHFQSSTATYGRIGGGADFKGSPNKTAELKG